MWKSNQALEMNSGADGSCPLLNEYKREYLRSRLPQTIFGGVRVRNVPYKGVISQLFVLLFPFILAIIATLIDYFIDAPIFYIRVVLGGLLSVLLTIINFIPRSDKLEVDQDTKYRFKLEEEEKVRLDSILDILNFIFPKNKTLFYKLADPLLYGAVFILVLEVSSNSAIQSALNLSEGGFIILFVFLWVSYSIGLYPLVSNPPPEVVSYKDHDTLGLGHLYRPIYITLCSVVILALTIDRSNNTGEWYNTSLQTVQYNIVIVGYVLTTLLPLLFFIGVLPPIECLFSWLVESWLVIFCGASPISCEIRKTLQLIITSVTVAATHHQLLIVPILSPFICCNVLAFSTNVYKSVTLWVTVLYCTISSVSMAAVAASYGHENMNTLGLEVLILVLFVFMVLVESSRRVYWFNLIRNPVYSKLNNLPRFYKWLGRVGQFLHPLVLSLFLYCTLSTTMTSSDGAVTSSDTLLTAFTSKSRLGWFNSVLICRTVRLVWQDSRHSLMYFSLYIVSSYVSMSTEPVLVMWICSLLLTYSDKVLQLLHLCIKLQLDSLLLKKQRRAGSLKLALVNLLLLPLIWGIVVVAAVIGAPILPLFTLPLYLLSYPRPAKFGPVNESHSASTDTAFYRQITPRLMRSDHLSPDHMTPGSFYLSRVENLLILTHVVETGFGYSNVTVKGLELQETSCHTEEANIIKDIFEQSFHSNKCVNEDWLHVMQPVSMTHIETYSDARNVLTGVLDSPDCLKSIPSNFVKCLTYFLCKDHVEMLPPSVQFNEQTNTATNKTGGKVGFDFTGLQSKAKSVLSEVDNEKVAVKKDDDFLDNLSFGSEDSWYDTVVTNRDPPILHISEKEGEVLVNRTVHEVSGRGAGWARLPYTKSEVKDVDICQHILSYYCNKYSIGNELKEVVKWITCAASVAVNGKPGKTANQVVKTYQGHVEWGIHSEWLNDNPDLKTVIIKAYQHAVKVSIDELIFGPNETVDEFNEALTDLTTNHYIGLQTDILWASCISNNTPKLFTLCFNAEGIYSSRTLTLTTLPLYTGKLNTEVVKAVWAALSLELLYLTNDDEERYSIQAHPNLLRNIITQAADVPLGYPIFLSGQLVLDKLS